MSESNGVFVNLYDTFTTSSESNASRDRTFIFGTAIKGPRHTPISVDSKPEDIFGKARQNGEGDFYYHFNNTYDFIEYVRSFGNSTVFGDSIVHVIDKEEYLIVSTNIVYNFYDEYKDPYDYPNFVEEDINWFGTSYKIEGNWSTRLEAIIKKDKSVSKYQ